MTTIAVSTETPEITCPEWCTIPYAEHVANLRDQEGYVIHQSDERGGVKHCRSAYVDNVVDPTDPPLVFVYAHASDGVSLDDAEALANRILEAVREARS